MKKTVILTLAALMTVSVSSAVATTINTTVLSALTDKKPAKKKKGEVKEVTFNVYLHCENCVEKVQENIAFEKGVKDLKVSLEDQTVAVKYDAAKTSEEVLKAALAKLGYPVTDGKHEHQHDHEHHDHH